MSLSGLAERYLANNQVDLLSLDIEGFDLAALRSNDWSRLRPLVLCLEMSAGAGGRPIQTPDPEIDRLVRDVGYELVGIWGVNAFYRRTS